MPLLDIRVVACILVRMDDAQHVAPERDDVRVQPGRRAATRYAIAQMIRQTDRPNVQPFEDMRILVHLTDPVIVLVLIIRADFQFDHRVNGHIGDHVRGVAEKLGQPFAFRLAV